MTVIFIKFVVGFCFFAAGCASTSSDDWAGFVFWPCAVMGVVGLFVLL